MNEKRATTNDKISEGEIWHVKVDGVTEHINQPVLILKKLGSYSFMGIPLSVTRHRRRFDPKAYDRILHPTFNQTKIYNISKLRHNIGRIAQKDMKEVWTNLHKIYAHI